MTLDWQLLQWLDSAFPTGAYAHSAGFEAWAHVAPRDADVVASLRALVRSQTQLAVPYVRAAFESLESPERFHALDESFDACLWGASANRASRVQGRSLLEVSLRSFPDHPGVQAGRRVLIATAPLHHGVVFGGLARAFTTSADAAAQAFVFSGARAAVSAAVRLNLLGPFEAQRVLASLGSVAMQPADARSVEHAASGSPYLDLVAEHHSRLHTRLFST